MCGTTSDGRGLHSVWEGPAQCVVLQVMGGACTVCGTTSDGGGLETGLLLHG